jgi:hypothetical protein
VSSPCTHDYTEPTRSWSHDTVFTPVDEVRAVVHGWGAGIHDGDFLLLDVLGLTACFRVEEIAYHDDPLPFWRAVVEFTPVEVAA